MPPECKICGFSLSPFQGNPSRVCEDCLEADEEDAMSYLADDFDIDEAEFEELAGLYRGVQ